MDLNFLPQRPVTDALGPEAFVESVFTEFQSQGITKFDIANSRAFHKAMEAVYKDETLARAKNGLPRLRFRISTDNINGTSEVLTSAIANLQLRDDISSRNPQFRFVEFKRNQSVAGEAPDLKLAAERVPDKFMQAYRACG